MEQYVQKKTGGRPQPKELIKDHHFFEFLGIAGKSVIEVVAEEPELQQGNADDDDLLF